VNLSLSNDNVMWKLSHRMRSRDLAWLWLWNVFHENWRTGFAQD